MENISILFLVVIKNGSKKVYLRRNHKMKHITTYAEFQALKAIYKSAKVVSVSDHGALIFLRK